MIEIGQLLVDFGKAFTLLFTLPILVIVLLLILIFKGMMS